MRPCPESKIQTSQQNTIKYSLPHKAPFETKNKVYKMKFQNEVCAKASYHVIT